MAQPVQRVALAQPARQQVLLARVVQPEPEQQPLLPQPELVQPPLMASTQKSRPLVVCQ